MSSLVGTDNTQGVLVSPNARHLSYRRIGKPQAQLDQMPAQAPTNARTSFMTSQFSPAVKDYESLQNLKKHGRLCSWQACVLLADWC